MTGNWIKQLIMFIILVLIQVLVLNHISFLGYATPFLYIYFIIKIPIGTNRNLVLILAFILGIIIDIFCNTLGQNAAATVFAAFMRRPVQSLFFDREDFEHFIPSISNLGIAFMKYTIVIVFLHNLVLILISSFSYLDFNIILLRILSSTIMTTLLIYAIEGFFIKKKRL